MPLKTPSEYGRQLLGARPEDVEYAWMFNQANKEGDAFGTDRKQQMQETRALAMGGRSEAGDQARAMANVAGQQQMGAARSMPTASLAAQGRLGRGGAQAVSAQSGQHIAALEAAEQQQAQRQYLALQQEEAARLQQEEQQKREMELNREMAEARDVQEKQEAAQGFWGNLMAGAATIGMAAVKTAPMWMGILSDEDEKENIEGADRELYGFLDQLDAKEFEYKGDPESARKFGVMAQDAQESPVGQSMVNNNRPLTIDPAQAQGATLAALASLHDRLKKIEGGK